MGTKEDLRYQKTEDAIREAFLDLLTQQSLQQISVTGVCATARISRNAFYAHYTGMTNLYERMMEELAETARDACRRSNKLLLAGECTVYEASVLSIEMLAPYERTLRTFLSADNGVLSLHLSKVAYEELTRSIRELTGKEPSEPINLVMSYIATGLVGYLWYWLTQTQLPLAEAAPIFAQVHSNALEALRVLIEPSTS